MANFIISLVLITIFGLIIYYLVHSIRTKGTTCTSCTSCPVVNKCNKDTVKSEMLNFYKNLD